MKTGEVRNAKRPPLLRCSIGICPGETYPIRIQNKCFPNHKSDINLLINAVNFDSGHDDSICCVQVCTPTIHWLKEIFDRGGIMEELY
jgi:hypothetical protein